MKKIALLGSGFIAGVHMEGWKRIPGAEVVAFYEVVPEKARVFQEKYSLPYYSSLPRLLEEKEVDIVDICLPTFLHREYTIQAANAKKHVMCEKPMALTVDDAVVMKNACQLNGVELMVGHALRFWGEYVKAKELVTQEAVGKVLTVGAYRLAVTPGWSVISWILQQNLSGGAAFDLHIHDLDFTNWIAGKPEEVFARGVQSTTGAWDHVVTSVRYVDGAISHVEGGWMMKGEFPFTMGYRIMGTAGILEWEFRAGVNIEQRGAASPVILYRDGKPREEFNAQGDDAYYLELKYFYECIESHRPIELATADHGITAVRVAAAARESLEKRMVVRI
ncbi:MAG: Gfo/Idh/MocA family oxidoreductase [Atribacterota bacterium]